MTDNNAADYLVRSIAWASTIASDESAMTYIGLDNYCARTLVRNETWSLEIVKSSYVDNVMNVQTPTMSGNSSPAGVGTCSASEQREANYGAWKGFDKRTGYDRGWQGTLNSSFGVARWLCFTFPSPVKIYGYSAWSMIEAGSARSYPITHKIQAYDGENWIDIGSGNGFDGKWSGAISNPTDAAYSAYRLWSNNWFMSTTGNQAGLGELQFYGRKDI